MNNIHFSISGGQQLFFVEAEEGEEGEEGEEEPAPNPVIPELNHMAWALGTFLILWAMMHFVLLPPLLKKREERELQLKAGRDAADKAKVALSQAQAEYDAEIAKARAEADAIIEAARAEAGEHRSAVMAEAISAAATVRSEASGGLDARRDATVASMRGDVGDIAVAAASAVLDKDLDRAAQQSVIDASLSGGAS